MRVLSVGNPYPPEGFGGDELMWRACNDEVRATTESTDGDILPLR